MLDALGEPAFRRPRRLACAHCTHTDAWPPANSSVKTSDGKAIRHHGGVTRLGGPFDPYFRHALWLQAPFRKHTLWFYNPAHIDLIADFVAAPLRTRVRPDDRNGADRGWGGHATLLERLPSWIKSTQNRAAILKTIADIRSTITDSN